VPDQSKSMPSLLSKAYTMNGWFTVDGDGVTHEAATRDIGAVPGYVVGAGNRACGGCHRAELINEDAEGEIASLNAHVDQMGFLVDTTTDTTTQYLYGVMDKIMGYFE
jgi:hypothetical protein